MSTFTKKDEDFTEVKDLAKLRKWLKAAYDAGKDSNKQGL